MLFNTYAHSCNTALLLSSILFNDSLNLSYFYLLVLFHLLVLHCNPDCTHTQDFQQWCIIFVSTADLCLKFLKFSFCSESLVTKSSIICEFVTPILCWTFGASLFNLSVFQTSRWLSVDQSLSCEPQLSKGIPFQEHIYQIKTPQENTHNPAAAAGSFTGFSKSKW